MNLLIAIILSISPISELRGGIPYALATTELTLYNVLFLSSVCIIANALMILPLFFFLDFFNHKMMRFGWYSSLFDKVIRKIQKRSHQLSPQIDKYGYIALTLFVGVPLPITGAWTGAIAAWLLDLDRKKSIIAIFFGVIMAGVIITLASLGFLNLLRL